MGSWATLHSKELDLRSRIRARQECLAAIGLRMARRETRVKLKEEKVKVKA